MATAKKRPDQHVIDNLAQELLHRQVPDHWVVREYRPDYGIDFDVEVFETVTRRAAPPVHVTLGEHFFIQLKGIRRVDARNIAVHSRTNVEKPPRDLKAAEAATVDVVPYQLEVSELVTVQRMGPALPVLLVVADVSSKVCYFVCLNDYVDKVLLATSHDFGNRRSKVVHVPLANRIDSARGQSALRWYAKRAKLYAAFQKFNYQSRELRFLSQFKEDEAELLSFADHFARILARYDFWKSTEMWAVLADVRGRLEPVLNLGAAEFVRLEEERLKGASPAADADGSRFFARELLVGLWETLATMGRIHEEICREWFLPTQLGLMTSFPARDERASESASPRPRSAAKASPAKVPRAKSVRRPAARRARGPARPKGSGP
jgi:hypothetical protein